MFALLAILVFVSAVLIDVCNTQYVKAVARNQPHQAAVYSVLQWVSSLIGFIIAFKVTLWLLPFEALGLYVGTRLSMDWWDRVKVPRAVAKYVGKR